MDRTWAGLEKCITVKRRGDGGRRAKVLEVRWAKKDWRWTDLEVLRWQRRG